MTYPELWHRLTNSYDEGEAKAITRYLLEVGFGLTTTDIYCGKVEQLPPSDQDRLEQMMRRLEQSEPVQYVLGVADFCGRPFHVAPGVLIPRPETDELCRWIVNSERRGVMSDKYDILDIGTGSGCIAVTLAVELPDSKVTAWDISDKALQIARNNAKRAGVHVSFEHQDALAPPAITSQWNLIVSNPPYIDEARERDGMAENVLAYEPPEALFGPREEPDRFYRRIGDYAFRGLKPGGRLYFELNPLTAGAVGNYLQRLGFNDIEIRQDQFGKDRFLKATKI